MNEQLTIPSGFTGEEYKTTCAKCSHTRKKKNDKCLSVRTKDGVYQCFNCGDSGILLSHREERLPMTRMQPIKTYVKPSLSETAPDEKVLKWFEGRGISKETVLKAGITTSKEYFGQIKKEATAINFNYFRNGELLRVKYRGHPKLFSSSKESESLLYNLQNFNKDVEHVVICEGEMDVLALMECGVENAVSVPNGANNNLDFLNADYHLIEGKVIIICADNDEPGKKLEREIIARFGEAACAKITYPEDCKDINDVLMKHGKEVVQECVDSVELVEISGIQTVADYQDLVDNYYLDGYPKGDRVKFSNKVADMIRFIPKQLTVVVGTPGSGKSEVMDQICIDLAEGINQDELSGGWQQEPWSFGMVSLETPPELHFIRMAEKYTGVSFPNMTEDELYSAKQFINQRFYWIDKEGSVTPEFVIEKAIQLKKRYGIKGLVIDPYSSLSHDFGTLNEANYIAEFMNKLTSLAKQINIHVFLVVHPTKAVANLDSGKVRPATLYDAAGSAALYNLTSNGLSVYRDKQTNEVFLFCMKVKYKYLGYLGKVELKYNKENGRYSEV